ncbi:hypothetical protein [Sphaerisporangium sp. NPDC051011]|uniref:hypothetical protein n=1 Tax=Sphaerisporangium sp. NPDC051011 TaxID=3155792 RepID=UPI0033C421EA
MTTPSAAGPERLGPALIEILTRLPEERAHPVRAKLRELRHTLDDGVSAALDVEAPEGREEEYRLACTARQALETVLKTAHPTPAPPSPTATPVPPAPTPTAPDDPTLPLTSTVTSTSPVTSPLAVRSAVTAPDELAEVPTPERDEKDTADTAPKAAVGNAGNVGKAADVPTAATKGVATPVREEAAPVLTAPEHDPLPVKDAVDPVDAAAPGDDAVAADGTAPKATPVAGGQEPSGGGDPASAPLSREEAVAGALRELCRELSDSPETEDYAAAYELNDLTGPALTGSYQEWPAAVRRRADLLFLRLAEDAAEAWRRRSAALVAQALRDNGHTEEAHAGDLASACGPDGGAAPEPPDTLTPDVDDPDVLDSDALDPRRGRTRTLARVSFDPEVVTTLLGANPERGEPWRRLAELAASMIWLAEHDPATWIGLEAIAPDGGLRPAADEVTSYREAIASRFGNLLEAEPGSAAEFARLAETDEAIRGLVPMPFPRRDSWWDRQVRSLRTIIVGHPEGHGATVITPGSIPFKNLRKENKVAVSIALRGNGYPGLARCERGSVVWTLRVGYGSNNVSRVVYVPS